MRRPHWGNLTSLVMAMPRAGSGSGSQLPQPRTVVGANPSVPRFVATPDDDLFAFTYSRLPTAAALEQAASLIEQRGVGIPHAFQTVAPADRFAPNEVWRRNRALRVRMDDAFAKYLEATAGTLAFAAWSERRSTTEVAQALRECAAMMRRSRGPHPG